MDVALMQKTRTADLSGDARARQAVTIFPAILKISSGVSCGGRGWELDRDRRNYGGTFGGKLEFVVNVASREHSAQR